MGQAQKEEGILGVGIQVSGCWGVDPLVSCSLASRWHGSLMFPVVQRKAAFLVAGMRCSLYQVNAKVDTGALPLLALKIHSCPSSVHHLSLVSHLSLEGNYVV